VKRKYIVIVEEQAGPEAASALGSALLSLFRVVGVMGHS